MWQEDSWGLEEDEAMVLYRAWRADNIAVSLNINWVPEDLIGGGHHRNDQVRTRQECCHSRNHCNPMNATPIRLMMQSVADQGLSHPNLNNLPM